MAPNKKTAAKSNLKAAHQVYQHIPIIQAVRKANNVRLRGQILYLSPSTVKAISSLTENAMNGNLPVSKAIQRRMASMNKELQAVAKGSHESRRKAIQKGGAFLPLLGAILPIAASVIGSLFGRKD